MFETCVFREHLLQFCRGRGATAVVRRLTNRRTLSRWRNSRQSQRRRTGLADTLLNGHEGVLRPEALERANRHLGARAIIRPDVAHRARRQDLDRMAQPWRERARRDMPPNGSSAVNSCAMLWKAGTVAAGRSSSSPQPANTTSTTITPAAAHTGHTPAAGAAVPRELRASRVP